jgi:hypothetical protein
VCLGGGGVACTGEGAAVQRHKDKLRQFGLCRKDMWKRHAQNRTRSQSSAEKPVALKTCQSDGSSVSEILCQLLACGDWNVVAAAQG